MILSPMLNLLGIFLTGQLSIDDLIVASIRGLGTSGAVSSSVVSVNDSVGSEGNRRELNEIFVLLIALLANVFWEGLKTVATFSTVFAILGALLLGNPEPAKEELKKGYAGSGRGLFTLLPATTMCGTDIREYSKLESVQVNIDQLNIIHNNNEIRDDFLAAHQMAVYLEKICTVESQNADIPANGFVNGCACNIDSQCKMESECVSGICLASSI